MSLCKFCTGKQDKDRKHLHKDCKTDAAVAAKKANDEARAAAAGRPAAMTEYDLDEVAQMTPYDDDDDFFDDSDAAHLPAVTRGTARTPPPPPAPPRLWCALHPPRQAPRTR